MSMPYCEWSESMSVGVSLLDADHRFLAGHISRMHQDLQDGAAPEALEQRFDGLIAVTEFHFFREAKVMETCGFPEARAYQEERADFIRYIYEWRDRHPHGAGPPITVELLHYLKNWFNHHVLIWDMAYKPYVENNALAVEVAETFGSALFDGGTEGVHHEPG